jgi:hypothetical protein
MVLHRIDRFQALDAAERRLFIQAVILLPFTALSVRVFGIKPTLAWLNSGASAKRQPAANVEQARAQAICTVHLVQKAIRHGPYAGNCLSQSLTLWRLLRHQGIMGDLRIGVQKSDAELAGALDGFRAHAWVEYKGVVLNDRPDVGQRYAAFEQAFAPSADRPTRSGAHR